MAYAQTAHFNQSIENTMLGSVSGLALISVVLYYSVVAV